MGLISFIQGVAAAGFDPDPALGIKPLADAREALTQGDFAPARALVSQIKKSAERCFVFRALYGENADALPALEAWTEQHPNEADAWTLKGAAATIWAWDARTAARAQHVSEDKFIEFFRRLEVADGFLNQAIRLAPKDAQPYAQKIYIDVGLQRGEEMALKHFGKAYRRDKSNRTAHRALHMFVQEKWFGSHEKSFKFARSRAKENPVFNALIANSHIEKQMHINDFQQDFDAGEAYFKDPSNINDIEQAFGRYTAAVPATPENMDGYNAFLFCFYLIGDASRVRFIFDRIGDRITQDPWLYLMMPARAIKKARKLADSA